MNERPDPLKIREGFVDPDKPTKPDAKPEITPPPAQPAPADQPKAKEPVPPPLEPSPADADAEEAAAQRVFESWPITVKLMHKKIRNNAGEEISELTFREPKGGDINRYGNPVRYNTDGDLLIDERKMSWMMAGLSGVLFPMLEQMDPRDWTSCAHRLARFFQADYRGWVLPKSP